MINLREKIFYHVIDACKDDSCDQCTGEILKLVQGWAEELVGEDEDFIRKIIISGASPQLKQDLLSTQYYRNELRQELREKIKEDLK